MPTITDNPVLLQPPAFENSVKTALAEFRGARIHKVITIAKNPRRCIMRTKHSIMGNLPAKNVLKMIANVIIAITKSVPCQRSYM